MPLRPLDFESVWRAGRQNLYTIGKSGFTQKSPKELNRVQGDSSLMFKTWDLFLEIKRTWFKLILTRMSQELTRIELFELFALLHRLSQT